MDDFPGILARDFGFKPQGKSAPMAAPRNSYNKTFSSSFSGPEQTSSASSLSSKSGPIFDDHDPGGLGDGMLYNDVFGGPPKFGESRGGGGNTASSSSATSYDYDLIFKNQNAKSSSLPVFDKPVYDEDIFDGLPGLKSSSSASHSAKFDNVFATVGASSSPPKHKSMNSSAFDDLLGSLGKKGAEPKIEEPEVAKDSYAFEDLLPGFGRSSSPSFSRSTSESIQSTASPANSAKTTPATFDDPFVVIETTSTPAAASSGQFLDPLEEIDRSNSSGSTKFDGSLPNKGSFDDLHPLDNLTKSIPSASSEVNVRKDSSPLRSEASMSGNFSPSSQDPVDKYPVETSGRYSKYKAPVDDFLETPFGMSASSTDSNKAVSTPPSYANVSANETFPSPVSEDVTDSADEIWLTVSEIPLLTKPTSAPPPSRPPPPRPPRLNARKKFHEYPFSNSQSPSSTQASRSSVSHIDELEDFVIGRTPKNVNDHTEFPSGNVHDTNSSAAASAAAMKEAMDKAEAKFRQMREREPLKASRSKEATRPDRNMLEAQQRELRERQERLDLERQQKEMDEEDREQRRLREMEREREEEEKQQKRRERERERARLAVERATREARERAAADARVRAERAAVEKAAAEARGRAERAAVQRAQAEARERAAAEARERAERAASEARERANAEAREKGRETRARAERVAVERVAAEARERAAATARANQQKYDAQPKTEDDLESFFSSRPSSAPRPRASTSDPFFDTANKGAPEPPKRTSVGSTSSLRKASSTANIVDDLSSIFGASGAGQSGDFQDVEGETEERRRARLERHQRTQERAAKALAEKNQRDLQAQRDQEERHRIGETLDFEIKRWAAGKEGNLRALLSTLQYVLWPGCGWQPVSLTDLITGASVKKAYRKATLCIHPDKVQQKGANLQQKYIAEKVFDLLKEAWNKFNSEELF